MRDNIPQNRIDLFNRKKKNILRANNIKGYAIYDIKNKCYIGFQTTKGFLCIWNEARKAKLAFSYHTGNTIDERFDEYEIRIITNIDLLRNNLEK